MKRPVLTTLFVALTLFCLCALTASSAFAQDDAKALLAYAPADSGAVFGMNVGAAQKTTFFSELMKTARLSPDTRRALRDVEKEIGLKVDKDLHAFIVATPKLTRRQSDNFTMIMSGDFDIARIKQDLEKEKGVTTRKIGSHTSYQDKKTEVILLNDKLIMLSGGTSTYRDASLKVLQGKKINATADAQIKALLGQVDQSKHAWVVANASGVKGKGPGVNTLAFTFDLSGGLKLSGNMDMKSASDAAQVKAEIDKNTDQGLAFASLIGAPSVFKNLKVTQAGNKLDISTSLPDKEVSALGSWLRNMIQAQLDEQERAKKAAKEAEKAAKEAEKASAAPAP